MLSKPEIYRRVRAIAEHEYKTSDKRRPFSLYKLGKVSGIDRRHLCDLQENMRDATQAALSQALLWLENDQIRIKGNDVTIQPPKPQCKMGMRIQVTDKGFAIVKVATNPLAYPPPLTPRTLRR